ncbi:MAG: MerR family transcriptional regulator [Acidimicrobiales bacterium]|nr:MerR family transcriptional regulator [Acidimicrobiales bacterium]
MSSDASTSPPDVDDEVDERLKIGEVARRCGVSTRTLRYYEEVGLIAPVDSTEGGFRLYDSAVIDRVERIVRFKDVVHLSLDEIRRTLDDEDRVRELWELHQVEPDAETHDAVIAEHLAALRRLHDLVAGKRAQLDEVLAEITDKQQRAELRRQSLAGAR